MSSAAACSVLVANLSAPELNHLAAELDRRGQLRHYVRPYVNKRRWWERALGHVPVVGKQLRRRTPATGVPLAKIVGAGVLQDIAAAAVGRMPGLAREWRRRAGQDLLFAAERKVARRCAALLGDVNVVVASYGTGRYAFEAARRDGVRCLLNYPIAHNRYQQRVYEQEAQRAPEFAAALPRLPDLPPEYSERLEVECDLAERILVGSAFVRQSFVELGFDPRRIVVLPYGVDPQRFQPRAAPRQGAPFRVLFVGQIGQRKGVGYLLRAYRQFRRPDTELQLVGSFGAGGEAFQRYAELYRHTPKLVQQELPSVLRDADVLVLPSLIEGMPLVVLEAMACGLPVIVTRCGADEVVRDGIDGYIIPMCDPEAIAERLERLYGDAELRRQMGREARQQALRFDWARFAQRAADEVLGLAGAPSGGDQPQAQVVAAGRLGQP